MFGRNKDDRDDASLGLGTGLEPGADAPSGTRITALDIQQRQFSSQRKGYSEAEVDEFLDQITEELVRLSAESKRSGGSGGGDGNAAAVAEAELIRRKAREDAEAILADARARAAVMGTSGGVSPSNKAEIQAFLNQEREFLHSIAGLVQGHAATITGMAKEARGANPASGESKGDSSKRPSASSTGQSTDSSTARPGPSSSSRSGTSAWAATAESGTSVATVPPDEVADVAGQGTTGSVVQIPASDVDAPSDEPASDPAPAAAEPSAQSQGVPPAGDDRSLRELFWGED